MTHTSAPLHPVIVNILEHNNCATAATPSHESWQNILQQISNHLQLTEEHLSNINQDRLNEAQRIANIGSWVFNHISNTVYWSDQTFVILGYAPQSFEPNYDDFLHCIHPDDRQFLIDFHKEALQGRSSYTIDYRLLTQDGKIKYVQEHSENIYDENNNPVSSSGTLQDLTIQKQQEEQLRRSQKMQALGNLAGGIAHDFNNLLGVMIGYAELLQLTETENEDIKLYADNILKAGERGARLARRMLSFSQHDSVETSITNINDVISEEQLMLQKSLTVRVKLDLNLSPDLWPAELNIDDLKDAILNVSINAMHAMPEGGELIINTQNISIKEVHSHKVGVIPGDYIRLSFKDTGIGMDEKTRNQLFDPFFTTKGKKGTGLGMSQVYGFIKRCKGAIDVISETGKGTEIIFYLPRHHMPVKKQQAAKNETPSGHTNHHARILVVDDEPSLCELISKTLNNHYRVITAQSAGQALDILKSESIDILLSDVIMPVMDGYELAEEVHRLYPHIKIQMISGYSDTSHKLSPFSHRLAQQRLLKPLASRALLNRVAELLNTDSK